MSILDTLAQEHRRIETLLSALAETSSADADQRVRLFSTLQSTLIAHSRAEEEVVYRVLRRRLPDEVLVLEAYEEHHIADVLLQELATACPGGRGWAAKVRVFGEVVRHHIKEEEVGLFPLVTRACDPADCVTMDAEFQAISHPSLESAMGPLRCAMPAFAGRALVDVQAMAGRYARRGELRVLRALDKQSGFSAVLPRTLRRRLPSLRADAAALVQNA